MDQSNGDEKTSVHQKILKLKKNETGIKHLQHIQQIKDTFMNA